MTTRAEKGFLFKILNFSFNDWEETGGEEREEKEDAGSGIDIDSVRIGNERSGVFDKYSHLLILPECLIILWKFRHPPFDCNKHTLHIQYIHTHTYVNICRITSHN